jgi:hypothetical protein
MFEESGFFGFRAASCLSFVKLAHRMTEAKKGS